jgi:hypothetical protein
MHILQKELIKRLVKQNGLKYSALTEGYSFDDNIGFHLRRLKNLGFIQKREDIYFLTKDGLEVSGTFDLDTLEDKRFKHVYIAFICEFENKFLIRERISGDSKFYKLIGGKPLLGKDFSSEVIRLFKCDTGLDKRFSDFEYDCTHFKIQETSKGEPLWDDSLVVYKIKLHSIQDLNLKEGNKWFSADEILSLTGKWPEIDICLLRKDWKPILEYRFVNNYNISESEL